MSTSSRSEALFARAKKVIPGGVNSPVRAFGAVGGNPRFIASADKEMITDVDGNTYIDYIGSWGPMILGHNHPAILEAVKKAAEKGLSFGAGCPDEVDMAELICEMVPSVEMVRMVNSGTEAVMSAIRAARGFTGRNKIIKFEGCYHGHCDAMLVKAGSGVMTSGVPDSAGVPAGCAEDTLTAVYNDIESVRALLSRFPEDVAAVIIEPVAANMGVVAPKEGFLKELRGLCTEYGTLLIFDEVITGFRLGIDGAQGYYGVTPDLTTFGKIIGAGMPVGAYGGRREIMEMVSGWKGLPGRDIKRESGGDGCGAGAASDPEGTSGALPRHERNGRVFQRTSRAAGGTLSGALPGKRRRFPFLPVFFR